MRYVTSIGAVVTAGCAALAVALAPAAGWADFDKPTTAVDCTKKKNKGKPECQKNHGPEMSDDEIYNAGYWMARQGRYEDALAVLKRARVSDDPRVLNAMGFATRKLGNVDAALPYYTRALALDPDYTLAREYLGEAYLAKGDLASARAQLGEIARRRGASCQEYAHLSEHIARFEAAAAKG